MASHSHSGRSGNLKVLLRRPEILRVAVIAVGVGCIAVAGVADGQETGRSKAGSSTTRGTEHVPKKVDFSLSMSWNTEGSTGGEGGDSETLTRTGDNADSDKAVAKAEPSRKSASKDKDPVKTTQKLREVRSLLGNHREAEDEAQKEHASVHKKSQDGLTNAMEHAQKATKLLDAIAPEVGPKDVDEGFLVPLQ